MPIELVRVLFCVYQPRSNQIEKSSFVITEISFAIHISHIHHCTFRPKKTLVVLIKFCILFAFANNATLDPNNNKYYYLTTMTKVAIIYYSMYGHIATMAESIKKGVEASGTASCDIYQVAETLPGEVLEKMGAPPKKEHPIMTPDKMEDYDAFLFGLSGRFGTFPAQMKVGGCMYNKY